MSIGQRVTADPKQHPHLVGQVLIVIDERIPIGTSTRFVRATDATGKGHWLRQDEIRPAPTLVKENTMTATERLDAAAKAIQAKTGMRYADAVKNASINLSATAETWLNQPREAQAGSHVPTGPGFAAFQLTANARARELMNGGLPMAAAVDQMLSEMAAGRPAQAISLSTATSAQPRAASFDELAMQYAADHKVPLKEAVHHVGKSRPDLAHARG